MTENDLTVLAIAFLAAGGFVGFILGYDKGWHAGLKEAQRVLRACLPDDKTRGSDELHRP